MSIEKSNIESLKKALNEFNVYDLDTYSSIELYEVMAKKINELVNEWCRYEIVISEEIVKQNNDIQYLMNEGLNNEVVSKINQMIANGTMDKIINTKLFDQLNSEIKEKANQTDLEVERKRIDSFTSLTEGSTTGDAELIDARTDDLGVTHTNVGEAFRRRTATLNKNIKIISDNVVGMSINLADISIETMTDNYYINPSNGELLAYSNWSASDFIDIKPNTEYSVVFYLEEQNKYLRQDSVYYAVYDDSGVFISGGNTGAFASPTTINSRNGTKLKISCTNNRVKNGYMMLILTSDESKVLGKDKTAYVKSGLVLGGLVKEELIKTKTELKTDVDEKLSVPKIILPNEFYVVVGHELSIYNENVILCDDINRYSVDWYINQGNFYEQYNECFRITPKSGKEGDYNVICTIRDKSTYSILAQKTMTMHIVQEKTFTNKNVLFIGDSRTSAGYYPYEIQTNLSNNGIISLGTVISNPWIGNVQKSISHEGRGGWSAKDYTTVSNKGGYTNAFLNPTTKEFDFSYYMTQQGYTSVDAVFINLGTNGMISNNLDGSIDDNISAMDTMISSIRSYSSTVPIIVELVTPPATQDGWTYVNHGGSVWEMMFNIFRNNEKVIEHYDGRKSEGIYLAPTIFNLDRKNDYGTTTMPLSARNPKEIVRQTNNVHPCNIGYYKMADVFWCLINALI